jgi:hypothetical protein
MLLKLAAAWTFVALSVSPSFGQSWGVSDVEPNPHRLSSAVRRAWQTDATGLMEMVTAQHPRGAGRCWNRKVAANARIDCFQRLIGKHFLRKVAGDSTPLRSWCLDDANPRRCLESLAAQEVELWRYNRMNAPPAIAQAKTDR